MSAVWMSFKDFARGTWSWTCEHPRLAVVSIATALVVANSKPSGVPGSPGAPSAPPAPPPRDYTIPGRVPGWVVASRVSPLLKDPESARYQNVTYRKRWGFPVFCGEVASKNGFGAYTDYQSFIIANDGVELAESVSARRFVRSWNLLCVTTDHDEKATTPKPRKAAHHARR